MIRTDRLWLIMAGWLLGVFLGGCSRSETVEVAGTVTWEGKPLSGGEIVFVPDDRRSTVGAGKIVDGAYNLHVKPGKKRVEIQATRETDRRSESGLKIFELYLPRRYNKDSELTADVTVDDENEFNFDLNAER